jgi:hypothetical protein
VASFQTLFEPVSTIAEELSIARLAVPDCPTTVKVIVASLEVALMLLPPLTPRAIEMVPPLAWLTTAISKAEPVKLVETYASCAVGKLMSACTALTLLPAGLTLTVTLSVAPF